MKIAGQLSEEETLTERTRMIVVALVVVLVGWAVPARAIAQGPVEFSGGAVKAVLGKSQPFASSAEFSQPDWVNLPGSALRVTVPSATSDLFSLTFSARCSTSDAVLMRVVAVVDGVGSVVQPSHPFGSYFCRSELSDTHTRTLLLRGGTGDYRFSVQFWSSGVTYIADWTFQVVVYD